MISWVLAAQVESIDLIDKMYDETVDLSDPQVSEQVELAKKHAKLIAQELPESDQYAVSLSGQVIQEGDPVQVDEPRDRVAVSVATSIN